MARDHRKLRVFHDAHQLTRAVYQRTRQFPKDEWFGLRAQLLYLVELAIELELLSKSAGSDLVPAATRVVKIGGPGSAGGTPQRDRRSDKEGPGT